MGRHRSSFMAGPTILSALCLAAAFLFAACRPARPASYELRAPGITARIDGTGAIAWIDVDGPRQGKALKAFTRLRDCEPEGPPEVTPSDTQVTFRRKWVLKPSGCAAMVTDRFSRGNGSIRWEVEVASLQGPWSTPVETHLVYPDSGSARFWTPWGDPRRGGIGKRPPAEQAALGILPSDTTGNWSDPLLLIPFVNDTIWYGAPPYRYDNPRIGFIPFQGNLLGIPLVTVSEEQEDRGLSLVLSPADTLLDLNLRVRSSGELVFSREFHRISSSPPVHFHMDLVPHESGWRGGLRWMTANYPDFFEPNLPQAHQIAGTGAYSSLENPFDIQKMRRMAFGVNWKASFDFPYMGMFLPPVASDTCCWARYGGGTTSVAAMRTYAAGMKQEGFHVLSYFNVTEFGAEVTAAALPRAVGGCEDFWPGNPTRDDFNITRPASVPNTAGNTELWKSADDFLFFRLTHAILRIPAAVPGDPLSVYPRYRPGGPYYTWGNGIIMDPGDSLYQQFLLDQAERHIRLIPDAEGICIDRMDWLRMYNEEHDDGVSWFAGRPTRSLLMSWRSLLNRLGPLMHGSGKAIFVNNHDKRIDLLKQTDGFFDEFTYAGAPLNLTALMGLRKPVLGWTASEKDLRPDPDAFFQRYLHLGVFPMAPFPANDHSLRPGAWVDKQYLAYGPLLRLLKGKRWVLEPHCIEADGHQAKVNLFQVPDGWVVPVTFGPRKGTVTLTLRNVPGLHAGLKAYAVVPGAERKEPVTLSSSTGGLRMVVGTRRGCALVMITRGDT